MQQFPYIVVLITCSSSGEAERISRALLEGKQVACVNNMPGVSSLFWWQGSLDSSQENLLIAKTRATRLPEIIRLVEEIHSYDVPEIIALPIIGGNQDYLDWIDSIVKE
ncbi:divalent-cation tolerance protein CutA [Chloroflexota bacterium]